MPPLSHTHTSVRILLRRVKLPFGDANDRAACHHISPSDICTHTHLQGLCYFLWLRACVHLLLVFSLLSPNRHVTSLLPPLLPSSPFLSPCNFTLSTLVSCLLANTDCLRPGLDFPVFTSPLLCFIFQSISTPTPHSLTHMFPLPHTFGLW